MSNSFASQNNACKTKIDNIQKQIDYAKSYGNSSRIAGLEKALAQAKKNCTDDKLRKELQTNITKQKNKVEERKVELETAKTKGDNKKIAEKQKKLNDEKQKLTDLQKEFNTYFK